MIKKNAKIIEQINLLGPWVHGFFNLGNGIIIQDKDELQKKRLLSTKDAFIKILEKYYSKKELENKTLCEIGCNAGYFLYELFKKFNFKKTVGIEPRLTNLKKARFIAKYFKLPQNRYLLKQMDVLGQPKIPKSDIVIVPGVIHHLDNHLKALEKIYSSTNELCIIETIVLTEKLNTEEVAKQLELKDLIYQDKKFQNQFGIVGMKLESGNYDGSTIHSTIVCIPTTRALILMMKHVGFDRVEVFLSEKHSAKKIYNKKSYRKYHSAIVIGEKNTTQNFFQHQIVNITEKVEHDLFQTYIPYKIIRSLYDVITNVSSQKNLNEISNLIYDSEVFFKTKKGERSSKKLKKLIGNKKYYKIIQSFKHAPFEKICFEYSKTCYHTKKFDEAEKVCKNLIQIMNLDWRVVYSTYFLLAKINYDLKNFQKAKKYNLLSLKAYPNFSLSKKFVHDIEKIIN